MDEARKGPGETYTLPPVSPVAADAAPRSAGALLRAAREKQGLHIAVLAATIKVSTAKLEALEQDRLDALPNATFARALAQSVCRSLKVDPRPVLALLPHADAGPLESPAGRLNAPFHDRSAREGAAYTLTSKPLFWAGGLLLLAAVAVFLLPAGWIEPITERPAAAVRNGVAGAPPATASPAAASAITTPVAAAPPAVAGAASLFAPAQPAASMAPPTALPAPAADQLAAASAPAAPVPAAASTQAVAGALPSAGAAPATAAVSPSPAQAPAAPPRPGLAQLSATAPTWVEVQDNDARILLSRTLLAGESVGVDGVLPLRLRIGNAAATQLTFRGRAVDLAAYTRDNVARIELR